MPKRQGCRIMFMRTEGRSLIQRFARRNGFSEPTDALARQRSQRAGRKKGVGQGDSLWNQAQ